MSYWGVSNRDEEGFIHVVPCDEDRYILRPHVLSQDCSCCPEPDEDEPRMLVHHDPQRSGH